MANQLNSPLLVATYNFESNKLCYNNVELYESLVLILDCGRFVDSHSCISIGKALHTAYKGSDVGLKSWINHIQRSTINIPNFVKTVDTLNDACHTLYNNFANNQITFRTLAFFAKKDSPKQYNDWLSNYSKEKWLEFKDGNWHKVD